MSWDRLEELKTPNGREAWGEEPGTIIVLHAIQIESNPVTARLGHFYRLSIQTGPIWLAVGNGLDDYVAEAPSMITANPFPRYFERQRKP